VSQRILHKPTPSFAVHARKKNGDRQLHLSVNERRTPDGVRREIVLQADREADRIFVLYDIYDRTVSDLVVLDGFVQCVLFHCMQRGLPVRIHGNLSLTAFRNLQEFQRVWTLWRPERYRHVDLIPDAVVSETKRSNGVIQAFSGGVDATFTLISNKYLRADRGGYDVNAAVLVHGFDVGYDNMADFQKLAARVRSTLDYAGVELKLVRTNSREVKIQGWLDSVSLQLTACLHQFADRYGTGLVASAEPYDAMCLPLGTNPITDPMLSGDLMTIVYDGAGYSRTAKVEAIAQHPRFREQLKVCWEGKNQHENCGYCEKCLRTRLNFAAVGVNDPGCFPGPFDAKMVRKLRAKTLLQVSELESIVTYARQRGLSDRWIDVLRRRIAVSRVAIALENATRWPRLESGLRSVTRNLRAKLSPTVSRLLRKPNSAHHAAKSILPR
jgi:hypothetical protein